MSTIQALLVGGLAGFVLGSLAWMLLGIGLGILQGGIEEALKEKLGLDKEGETKK
jgi:hypothetical protein|tara:strand:- start:1471 stop:1635 length:165 start_codon:yes stop_codon:yes gene_type:complete